MKKLLATMLLTLSLAIHAGLSTPPDGKITLYYEDGSKKIEKEYKHGQPIGIWKRWYDNGEIWGVITFANTALPNYDYSSQIVKIELRYSDKDNTIRYKGVVHGIAKTYWEEGGVFEEVKFEQGQPKYMMIYREDGTLADKKGFLDKKIIERIMG